MHILETLGFEFETHAPERSFRGTEAPLQSLKNCQIIQSRERTKHKKLFSEKNIPELKSKQMNKK